MGNDPKKPNFRYSDITEWSTLGRNPYAQIVLNTTTGQQGQLYTVPLDGTLDKQLETYADRNRQEFNFVRVLDVIKPERRYVCSNQDTIQVVTEPMASRLSDLRDIPFPQGVRLLLEVAKGFRVLKQYQNVVIFDDSCVGITPKGQVRVWLNGNFGSNYPPIKYLRNNLLLQIFDSIKRRLHKSHWQEWDRLGQHLNIGTFNDIQMAPERILFYYQHTYQAAIRAQSTRVNEQLAMSFGTSTKNVQNVEQVAQVRINEPKQMQAAQQQPFQHSQKLFKNINFTYNNRNQQLEKSLKDAHVNAPVLSSSDHQPSQQHIRARVLTYSNESPTKPQNQTIMQRTASGSKNPGGLSSSGHQPSHDHSRLRVPTFVINSPSKTGQHERVLQRTTSGSNLKPIIIGSQSYNAILQAKKKNESCNTFNHQQSSNTSSSLNPTHPSQQSINFMSAPSSNAESGSMTHIPQVVPLQQKLQVARQQKLPPKIPKIKMPNTYESSKTPTSRMVPNIIANPKQAMRDILTRHPEMPQQKKVENSVERQYKQQHNVEVTQKIQPVRLQQQKEKPYYQSQQYLMQHSQLHTPVNQQVQLPPKKINEQQSTSQEQSHQYMQQPIPQQPMYQQHLHHYHKQERVQQVEYRQHVENQRVRYEQQVMHYQEQQQAIRSMNQLPDSNSSVSFNLSHQTQTKVLSPVHELLTQPNNGTNQQNTSQGGVSATKQILFKAAMRGPAIVQAVTKKQQKEVQKQEPTKKQDKTSQDQTQDQTRYSNQSQATYETQTTQASQLPQLVGLPARCNAKSPPFTIPQSSFDFQVMQHLSQRGVQTSKLAYVRQQPKLVSVSCQWDPPEEINQTQLPDANQRKQSSSESNKWRQVTETRHGEADEWSQPKVIKKASKKLVHKNSLLQAGLRVLYGDEGQSKYEEWLKEQERIQLKRMTLTREQQLLVQQQIQEEVTDISSREQLTHTDTQSQPVIFGTQESKHQISSRQQKQQSAISRKEPEYIPRRVEEYSKAPIAIDLREQEYKPYVSPYKNAEKDYPKDVSVLPTTSFKDYDEIESYLMRKYPDLKSDYTKTQPKYLDTDNYLRKYQASRYNLSDSKTPVSHLPKALSYQDLRMKLHN